MRRIGMFSLVALSLAVAACGKGHKEAAALDKAADQSDPAAAAELHNQADAIRANGGTGNVAAPGSAAQDALQAAGDAAAANPANEAEPKALPVDPATGLTKPGKQ